MIFLKEKFRLTNAYTDHYNKNTPTNLNAFRLVEVLPGNSEMTKPAAHQ